MPELVHSDWRLSSRVLGKGLHEFLSFRLADESYVVELALVREISSPPALTKVPRAPVGVMGVCSVRGLLVTVFDLRYRLRVPLSPQSRTSRILLTSAGAEDELVGLFVDEVKHVIRLEGSEIEPPQSALGIEAPDYVIGVGRKQGDVFVVLNLVGLMS